MAIQSIEQLRTLFLEPESTPARICFGNPPNPPSFEEVKVVVFGVAFDDTATFGKGSFRGPEALRHTSARQVETYLLDEGIDVYEKVPVFDLGDFKIKLRLTDEERRLLHSEGFEDRSKVLAKIRAVMKQFDALREVVAFLRRQGKIPLMIGGEHTLSYWTISALAAENPLIIHFDAHRDAKKTYMDMELSHTTPMHHLVKEHNLELVQIGIRQADQEENEFAEQSRVKTFFPEEIRKNLASVKKWIKDKTRGRNVYITFDIDALDIAYTPCTGTPEPFGLTPESVVEIIKSVDKTAKLIGLDIMEVAARGDDFREGTIATQILLRILAREYVG